MRPKKQQEPPSKLFFDDVPVLNRSALVVQPTELFLEWARKNPDEDPILTLEEMTEESLT